MKIVSTIIKSMLIALLFSVLSLAIVQVLLAMLSLPAASKAVTMVTLTNGALLGATAVLLSRLSGRRERSLLLMLISLALAASAVLLGGFRAPSLAPPAIYAAAVLNALFVAPATTIMANRQIRAGRNNYAGKSGRARASQ